MDRGMDGCNRNVGTKLNVISNFLLISAVVRGEDAIGTKSKRP